MGTQTHQGLCDWYCTRFYSCSENINDTDPSTPNLSHQKRAKKNRPVKLHREWVQFCTIQFVLFNIHCPEFWCFLSPTEWPSFCLVRVPFFFFFFYFFYLKIPNKTLKWTRRPKEPMPLWTLIVFNLSHSQTSNSRLGPHMYATRSWFRPKIQAMKLLLWFRSKINKFDLFFSLDENWRTDPKILSFQLFLPNCRNKKTTCLSASINLAWSFSGAILKWRTSWGGIQACRAVNFLLAGALDFLCFTVLCQGIKILLQACTYTYSRTRFIRIRLKTGWSG